MTTTKKINQDAHASISNSLLHLLNEKVKGISKKSTLKTLQLDDLQELKNKEIILGIYSCQNESSTFLVYKIFVNSSILIKGSYKEYNIISNALLLKNKDKENITQKVNLYNNKNNKVFYDTLIQFVKDKINDGDLKPGEYILKGLLLGDLLEIEI